MRYRRPSRYFLFLSVLLVSALSMGFFHSRPELKEINIKSLHEVAGEWEGIKQLGAISAVTLVIAFVISFFMAGGPGKFIENITFMFIQGQAQELGLTRQDLDKVRASGILRGGGMKGLKNLSRSQREKLKKSSLFRGLSAQQKSKLRKKFERESIA